MNRRKFLGTTLAGAGLVLASSGLSAAENPAASVASEKIHIALIGLGKQGRVLMEAMANIPGLHVQAVCDIWEYARKGGAAKVRSSQGSAPSMYSDVDEMLAKEKGLDAVVIATPDFWHAPHAVKCLEAGLHVYCEKMMSNTIDGARSIVKAAEKSGKLCQIGHQRRSNPRYKFTLNRLINGARVCGQITNVNGQWNRSLGASQDIGVSRKLEIDAAVLQRYGYKDMHQFMNWRTYRDLSGGPISDLGAHQIDIFNWFLGASPKTIFATGGRSYFKKREHFDNVMCLFDYDTPQGEVRAFYEVLTTTSYGGGFFESFLGTEGSIRISELASMSAIYRESGAKPWDDLVDRGLLVRKPAPPKPENTEGLVASYESAAPEVFDLPGGFSKPAHQPHLENFFDTIRGKATLTCDARHAFECEAPIYWINPSADSKQPINLTAEHLSV